MYTNFRHTARIWFSISKVAQGILLFLYLDMFYEQLPFSLYPYPSVGEYNAFASLSMKNKYGHCSVYGQSDFAMTYHQQYFARNTHMDSGRK